MNKGNENKANFEKFPIFYIGGPSRKNAHYPISITVRLLVSGHFYFYGVSNYLLKENDISVLLL